MELAGYNKLTLTDYPGLMAALAFTSGCQLRCPFCHNPELVLAGDTGGVGEGAETATEFLEYLTLRRQQLDGVVVTGGEPLLVPGLDAFLQQIKALDLRIKLDTNGLLPERLRSLLKAGLVDYVALDYKNHLPDFAATVGLSHDLPLAVRHFSRWQETLELLRGGSVGYELRTTVVRELHPLATLAAMAKYLGPNSSDHEPWYWQSFLRSGPIIADQEETVTELSAYSVSELEQLRHRLLPLAPQILLRA